MRKTRPDNRIETELSDDQKSKLWSWMQTPGLGYRTIRTLALKEFKQDYSISILSRWWEERAEEESKERIIRASTVAAQIGDAAQQKLPLITAALKAQLTQAAFEMQLAGGNTEEVKNLISIVASLDRAALDAARLELDVDKFRLLEAKAKQADQAESVAKSDMTPEEKARRYKEIFGIAA